MRPARTPLLYSANRDGRIRTGNLVRMKDLLSPLSYIAMEAMRRELRAVKLAMSEKP